MVQTTIRLPEELKRRAEERARREGLSLDQLISDTLEQLLGLEVERPAGDPLFVDPPVFEGAVPETLSEEHDRFLYGDKS